MTGDRTPTGDTPTHGVHVIPDEVPEGVVPPSTSMATPKPRIVVWESDICAGVITDRSCADCEDDDCEHECHQPEPTGDLRERLANGLRCPVCNVPPGTACLRAREDNQQPHMSRVLGVDDDVLAVVEAETAEVRRELWEMTTARDAFAALNRRAEDDLAKAERRRDQAENRAVLFREQVRMEHDRAEEAEKRAAEQHDRAVLAEAAIRTHGSELAAEMRYGAQQHDRAGDADAAVQRVRDLADDMRNITGARSWADRIDAALAGSQPQVGVRLHQLRTARRLSLAALATAARMTRETIRNIETGKTTPLPESLDALAEALGVPRADLDQPPAPPEDETQHPRTAVHGVAYRTDTGRYVIADQGGWLPGTYETEEAARLALGLGIEQVEALRDQINRTENRPITAADIHAALNRIPPKES